MLKRQWLLHDLAGDPSPTYSPFIIPKTSKAVSLILNCAKQNAPNGCTRPRFSLQSWGQWSNLLNFFCPGFPLYGTHTNLMNALCRMWPYWSFNDKIMYCIFSREGGPDPV